MTGSTRFNPAAPFAPNGDLTTFYGSPNLNLAKADVHTLMGFIDHDFGNGLTVKRSTQNFQLSTSCRPITPSYGTLLPSAEAASCPQLAEGEIGALAV